MSQQLLKYALGIVVQQWQMAGVDTDLLSILCDQIIRSGLKLALALLHGWKAGLKPCLLEPPSKLLMRCITIVENNDMEVVL